MSDQIQKRIDDLKADLDRHEDIEMKRWRDHKIEHREDRKHLLQNRQFLIGLIILAGLEIGIALLTHYLP